MGELIAGVDEAGRGPLAGPVTAACVILDHNNPITGLADSKRLTERRREQLRQEIEDSAISWSVAFASAEEIDQINILQATMLAMRRAVNALTIVPSHVLVDGNRIPELPMPATAIVRGDATEACIAAASILAKTARDRYMLSLDQQFPAYGFAVHKGYPTVSHREAIKQFGVIAEHRRSFKPVRDVIANPVLQHV